MKNLPSSARRHRKFVFGALYEQLFSGYFEVDPRKGDFELIIQISSEESSKLYVSMIDPDEGVGKEKLLPSIVSLGLSLRGPGNVRGAKVGDVGAMHGFGYKSATTKEEFKNSNEHGRKIQTCSTLMRNYMEDNMRETLKSIITIDKSYETHGKLSYLPHGPGSRIMFSIDLANSAHYDVGDSAESVAVWTETRPGEAKNWYFILPNVSHNGSTGLAVMLHHGVVISWDGTKIYHCTSKTNVGTNNHVFGCMWSSSKK